jgi:hypothetical protein
MLKADGRVLQIVRSQDAPGLGTRALLGYLAAPELFCRLSWDEWLTINPPFPEVDFSTRDVVTRFRRNGYDWDIHGLLYTPAHETDARFAFIVIHGGAGSSRGKDTTPDGRPGVSRVLASQGFKVLSVDYAGHYPRGGIWTTPVSERQPVYLLDTELSDDEIRDRNRKCTFNVHVQGAAALADAHLSGRDLFAFGHSTGGPMTVALHSFSKSTRTLGIVGFGSGGPQGWRKEWLEHTNQPYRDFPIDHISRRSVRAFRDAGYEGPRDVCPWGGAEEYVRWANHARSQIKTGLCDNQLLGAVQKLEEYPGITGLPRSEYLDYLDDPDPSWLRSIGVLLLCSENDRPHWIIGDRLEAKYDVFMGLKYAAFTPRVQVIYVPKYSHYGIQELHNERIVYTWLWAFKSNFFSADTIPDSRSHPATPS